MRTNRHPSGAFHRIPNQPLKDSHAEDTSETVYISALALIKMLKHARAGVPLEVMGLMLGEFVDDFTVNVVDVFAMPQSGTSVSVESVDPVYQAKMLDRLKEVDRPENVVGWYHSHPGFGCWLSGVDVQTQQSFEQLTRRAVAVVIDPIQSVKGKVIIDAFRTIEQDQADKKPFREPRQTTCSIGHLQKLSGIALSNNLNRHYYSLRIEYRSTLLDQQLLINMNRSGWIESLKLEPSAKFEQRNQETMKGLLDTALLLEKTLEEEREMTNQQLLTKTVGKKDPRRDLLEAAEKMIRENVARNLASKAVQAWYKT